MRLIPGLKGYKLSVWSRSATINYDPSVLPVDFWYRSVRSGKILPSKQSFENVYTRCYRTERTVRQCGAVNRTQRNEHHDHGLCQDSRRSQTRFHTGHL